MDNTTRVETQRCQTCERASGDTVCQNVFETRISTAGLGEVRYDLEQVGAFGCIRLLFLFVFRGVCGAWVLRCGPSVG